MNYKEQNNRVKQIIIDLATKAGYGHPDYTNFNEIDYKFWEDSKHKDSVIILAQRLDKQERGMGAKKVRKNLNKGLPNNWIKVEDKLPDYDKPILAVSSEWANIIPLMRVYDNEGWLWASWSGSSGMNTPLEYEIDDLMVKYWMYLPELPKS